MLVRGERMGECPVCGVKIRFLDEMRNHLLGHIIEKLENIEQAIKEMKE